MAKSKAKLHVAKNFNVDQLGEQPLFSTNPEAALPLLQTFAINTIEAGQMPDGRLYLKYFLENGLGFATGLPRENLTTLYHQLGDVLG